MSVKFNDVIYFILRPPLNGVPEVKLFKINNTIKFTGYQIMTLNCIKSDKIYSLNFWEFNPNTPFRGIIE